MFSYVHSEKIHLNYNPMKNNQEKGSTTAERVQKRLLLHKNYINILKKEERIQCFSGFFLYHYF